jgi:lipopolysaccharide transport system permease protein
MKSVTPTASLGDFARKRELWWQFTVRAVETRHRGSYLGMVWAVLNPLLMLCLYGVVFGIFFKNRFQVLPNETGVDFALAMFLGLILFQIVAETMAIAPTLIVSQPNLVKKVVFPLEVLPLAQLGASWFHFLISLSLLLLGSLALGRGLTLSGLAWLPLIVMPLMLLTVGLAWLLAALGVFFRDIGQIAPFVSQIMLYTSAVVYSIKLIDPTVWTVLRWNPLLHTVQLAREAVLWQVPVNPLHLAYTWACGLAMFVVGGWFFRKMKPAFADVI